MPETSTVVTSLIGLAVVVYSLDFYFCRKKHPNEPKYVRPPFPLIGHALGIARYGGRYYAMVGKDQPEIFTLPIFNLRIYVTNTRRFLPVVQKHAKTLSFKPFSKVTAERLCRTSAHYVSIHEDPHAFLNDTFRETRNALAPGKALDYQNMGTGKSIENFVLRLEQAAAYDGFPNLPFYTWIKHVLTVAATDGVYGEGNPFRKSEVEENFWIWSKGAAKMMFGLPDLLVRPENRSLSVMTEAFSAYFSNDHEDAAEVVHCREAICHQNKVSVDDIARSFIGFNIALLGNTVPTAFWAVYDIISRPELLETIRQELQLNVIKRSGPRDQELFEFDVVAMRTKCPLLLSSYQETQRLRNVHAAIRKVLADTTIESPDQRTKYFLTKGNYLQMPSTAVHYDRFVWGNDPLEFDPYRFVKDNATIPRDQLPESYAFMSWGTAPHVCPARQFASTEVMLLTSMLALRFNFEDPRGTWAPLALAENELSTVLPPRDEVFLKVKRRRGWQGTWNLKMGDSTQKIPLASG